MLSSYVLFDPNSPDNYETNRYSWIMPSGADVSKCHYHDNEKQGWQILACALRVLITCIPRRFLCGLYLQP